MSDSAPPVKQPVKKQRATTSTGAKKTKKPIQVVAFVSPDGIEGSFTPEPRKPLIVHLPFSSSEVEFETKGEIRYDPNPPPQPEPYSEKGSMYFSINKGTEQEGDEMEGWAMVRPEDLTTNTTGPPPLEQPLAGPTVNTATPAVTPPSAPVTNSLTSQLEEVFTRAKVLMCYETKSGETLKVPETTPVACYWCAHTFSEQPCFLPTKEDCGTYTVYGNFCSPQCGLAYLLKEHMDSHTRWERMALLHRLYPTVRGGRLYPAPPRESLEKFGGPMTIEQYREFVKQNTKRIDIYQPPVVSILGVLDTKPIDFYDSSSQNSFTNNSSIDKFKSWSEQGGALRLKRSKPLKDRESTLDACIKIQSKRSQIPA
jgi:hypothetical protein